MVSIIMPVYNGGFHLLEAINSILNQSYSNFEFIIINDASTDDSGKILKKIADNRVKLYSFTKHLGVAKSLNKAISLAKGKFIARMDADDVAYPDRLMYQLNFMKVHPRTVLVGSWVELISDQGVFIRNKSYPILYEQIKRIIISYNPFVHPTLLMKSDIFQTLGGYDETLNGAEDYDLVLRISKKFEVQNIPKVLLKFRFNISSVTYKNIKQIELQSFKARLKALSLYKYSLLQGLLLLKPFISLCVPEFIKKTILQKNNFK